MTRRNFLVASITSFFPMVYSKLFGATTLPISGLAPIKPSLSVDLPLLLDCIALVETGGDDTKIGKSGERSKYQIGEKVWIQHVSAEVHPFTRRNFAAVCKGAYARNVAMTHITWLHQSIGPSVFAIALAWHVGLEGWRDARFQRSQRHYGERVRNLYRQQTNNPNVQ